MTVTIRSDAELLVQARDGDEAALGELYVRHRPAGLRVARGYGRAADAEDLVNEAFERMLGALRNGRGPAEAFRPYLFVTIRRLAAGRRDGEHGSLDELPDAVVAAEDGNDADVAERALVAAAFATLPDRWQTVLWHTAVEGRRPRDVARAVGMPANTVAVLAHRARERLRQRYLQAHIQAACPAACAPHRARLGAHLRGGLTRRHSGAVDEHLAECAECRRLVDELVDVNRLLARAVAPAFVLAGGGSSLLGSVAGGTGPTTIGSGTAGPVAGSAAGSGATGGSATGSSATTGAVGGGVGAGGAAVGAAGSAIGAAAVAKVAAAVVAVVGIVAVSPIDLRDDPDRPSVEVSGPASVGSGAGRPPAGTGASPPTTAPGAPDPAPSAPAPAPSATGGSGLAVEADVDLGGGDVELDLGVEVPLAPIPGGGVDAQVGAGLATGVDLHATWRAGALGTGTLALDVANPDADALVDARLVVDLSPGARPTSLLGTTCHATDPGLVGAVLSLLGSLTCGLGAIGPSDATTVSLPLAVLGSGQTAQVRVVDAGVELASTTVDLAR